MAERNYQDNLFEEVNELTRADKGIVNVSSFNDMYLTNKRFFTASIDYFGSHWNDITQINPDDYIKRLQDISKNKQVTENILYRTVPELKEFAEFIKEGSSGRVKRRLLALHRSESNKEVLDELERIIDASPSGSISKPVEKFLRSRADAITSAAKGLVSLQFDAEN